MKSLPLSLFLALAAVPCARSAEPFFKPDDVIALVGGEDMVAASDYGYLELLLQRVLPDYHVKVRCLAWEGDTVFEQARMLNYPTIEHQLDEIGATVVIAQFGQMESLAGTGRLPEFTASYEKLIARLKGTSGSRRLAIIAPSQFSQSSPIDPESEAAFRKTRFLRQRLPELDAYIDAIRGLAGRESARFVDISDLGTDDVLVQRDGVHLTASGHRNAAGMIGGLLGFPVDQQVGAIEREESLLSLIRNKNRLWERYRRPQNWAFLAGDRTNQPSSRDHRDPTKRWFPEEMKEFVPLIDAKDRNIWALAAKQALEKK